MSASELHLLQMELEEARERIRELEGHALCDACAGTGKPISGLTCMCEGTGFADVAIKTLRLEVVKARQENASLMASLSSLVKDNADLCHARTLAQETLTTAWLAIATLLLERQQADDKASATEKLMSHLTHLVRDEMPAAVENLRFNTSVHVRVRRLMERVQEWDGVSPMAKSVIISRLNDVLNPEG